MPLFLDRAIRHRLPWNVDQADETTEQIAYKKDITCVLLAGGLAWAR